ncbi:hypothetical protein O181_002474 [Austropuccinia psidii MF-1]|uniref:Uncharacterized protein n=1 Tax=Austropuccinia psidii MF-1 TaxID=1389203 RepID=A0A9Q3GCW2_9BASI|nr:hypothetical protein [Austropuccinia psidii MF-1]
MVVMKHKINYPLNPEEALAAITASNDRSGYTTINIPSNTAYNIPFNRQSNFLYDTGTLQATSVPKTIGTPALTKKVSAREQYISNFNSNGINASSIQKDRNPSTNIKRNFSTNRPDASRSEVYKKYKQNLKSNSSRTSSDTNKIKNQPINATVTKDNNNDISDNISYESAYLVTADRNTTKVSKRNNKILSSSINEETNKTSKIEEKKMFKNQ